MRISDWSSDVCSSDLTVERGIAVRTAISPLPSMSSSGPKARSTSRPRASAVTKSGSLPLPARQSSTDAIRGRLGGRAIAVPLGPGCRRAAHAPAAALLIALLLAPVCGLAPLVRRGSAPPRTPTITPPGGGLRENRRGGEEGG